MLAGQLENHVEKFIENYVDKRGHFLGNLIFPPNMTEEEKQSILERYERLRDDISPRLTAEVERITLLFTDYLQRKGFAGEKLKPWVIDKYLYQQTHEAVNEIINEALPRYGFDFNAELYRSIRESLHNTFRGELEENIYYLIEKIPTSDTPFSLTEQQKITYLEGTEYSGYIDLNTFEAFQLKKGSPTLVYSQRLGEFENLIFFHTHPQGDALPSEGDLEVGERQMVISPHGSLLLEGGKTKKEIQNEILNNVSKLFPVIFSGDISSDYYNTHLGRLKQILNNYKVTFVPKTIDDIKFLDWPETGFFGKEEQEIVKEWMSREYASANPIQRRGVQGGGIQKPITEFQNRGWLPPERRDIAGETLSEEEAEELKKLREEIRGLKKEEDEEEKKEEQKRYPSPLQDGMDVVPRTSDNLNYGSDFGGRRIRLSEKSDEIRVPQFGRPQEILPIRELNKEESRLVFDLSPTEYDELLAELQQLEPEEAIMILEELKQRQRKIKPPPVDAFAKPEERISGLETDEEMARRILEELEKE